MAAAAQDGRNRPQKNAAGRQSLGRIAPAIPLGLGTPRRLRQNGKQSLSGEDALTDNSEKETQQSSQANEPDSLISEEMPQEIPNPYVNSHSRNQSVQSGSNEAISAEHPHLATETQPNNASTSIQLRSPLEEKEVADIMDYDSAMRPPELHNPVHPSAQIDAGRMQTNGSEVQPQTYEPQQPQRATTFHDFSSHQKHFSDVVENHQSRPNNHSIVFGGYHNSSTPPGVSVSAQKPPMLQQQIAAQQSHGPDLNPASRPASTNNFGGPDSRSFHMPPHAYTNYYDYSAHGSQQQVRSEHQHHGRYSNRGRQHGHGNTLRHQNNMMTSGTIYNQVPQPFMMRPDQKTIFPDISRTGSQQEHRRRQSSINSTDGPMQMDPRIIVPDEIGVLVRYLCSHFGSIEFADYLMQFSHSVFQFQPTPLPAHGLILARSPKLRSLMSMPNSASQNGLKILNVPVSDRFLNVDGALIRAVMRLYGEALPDRSDVARLAASSVQLEGGSMELAQMRFALAFAASGHFLQIDEIISHALLLIGHMLSWTTITRVLAFALDGGLSGAFNHFDGPARDRESNASSIDGAPTKIDSPASAPAYGFYSDRLLRHVMMFFVYNVPVGFKFYSSAPQLNDPPRLPSEAEPKHGRSASRLSQIRFGDMTLEDWGSVDSITQTISSIFVTLPFPLLRSVFDSPTFSERLGPLQAAELLRAVVQERESRRQRALKYRALDVQAEEGVWRTVRWEESVESTDRNAMGVRVTRSLTASQTPHSNGSGKG